MNARFFCAVSELTLLITVVWLLTPDTAHAGYVDPGSGSVLVQTIVAVMAAFGRFVAKIKGFFGFKTPGN